MYYLLFIHISHWHSLNIPCTLQDDDKHLQLFSFFIEMVLDFFPFFCVTFVCSVNRKRANVMKRCLSALLLSATQLGCTSVTFYLFTGVHTHGLSSQRVLSSFDNCWQLRFGETLLWYSLPHCTLFFCQNKLHCCNNTHGDCLKIGIWCSFYYYLTPRLYLFSASFSQFQPVSAHFRPLFILWQI